MKALRVFPQMSALVGAVHELADRSRRCCYYGRRKRGSEYIRTADQPKDLELGVIGYAKAADCSYRLRESPDDEIDFLDHSLGLGDAPTVFADEAHRMSLVD